MQLILRENKQVQIKKLNHSKWSQLKKKRIQNQSLNLKQSNQFKKKRKQKLQKQKKILHQKIQMISRLIMMMKTIIDNRFLYIFIVWAAW